MASQSYSNFLKLAYSIPETNGVIVPPYISIDLSVDDGYFLHCNINTTIEEYRRDVERSLTGYRIDDITKINEKFYIIVVAKVS